MAEIGSFQHFVKDLGMRIAAGATVIGIFFGLGWVKRTDFLGLASLLGSGLAFYSAAFILVGGCALAWILYTVKT
jgi:hypothetical protein